MIMDRYKELVGKLYCEPKDEEILGISLLKTLESTSSTLTPPKKLKRKKISSARICEKRDISKMFRVDEGSNRHQSVKEID